MTINNRSPWFRLPTIIALLLIALASSAAAQKRDHLTDAESELIRYYRELDKRTEVLIKAADRRIAIINGTTPPTSKKMFKDEPEWGEIPKGTRAELLGDIAGILDEAITNIDDVGRRDSRSPLLAKSLKKLTAAANSYLNLVNALRNKTSDPEELAAIGRVAEYANQIIEAGGNASASAPEETDKKKKP